jgi:hypothetical protein
MPPIPPGCPNPAGNGELPSAKIGVVDKVDEREKSTNIFVAVTFIERLQY